MPQDVDAMVNRAIEAYNAGDREKARSLLMEATELDDRHEEAWMWLSRVVDSEEDQRICLENALYINPGNSEAQQRLDALDSQAGTDSARALLDETVEPETTDDYVGAFEDAFAGEAFTEEEDEEAYEDLFADEDFDEEEPEPAEDIFSAELDTEEEEEKPSPTTTSRRVQSPMEETGVRSRRQSSMIADDGDPFHLIPAAVKATRLPGTDEKNPGWIVPSIVLLIFLNLAALAFLIINTS